MIKTALNIWGRKFEITVEFDIFPGEEITSNQRKTLAYLKSIDYTDALQKTKDYIEENYKTELGNGSVDNIFRFVIPKSVLILRVDDCRSLAILCDFRFDMEHGLAIVFENEKFKTIGPQDIVL